MARKLFRLTKTKKFVLNNHWKNVRVHPKHSLFFIPRSMPCVEDWITFLCKSHNRDFLYLHEISLRYKTSGFHLRLLKPSSMQASLPEVVLDADAEQHITVLKTMKVFAGVPVHWSYFQERKIKPTSSSWYERDPHRKLWWTLVRSNKKR